MRRAAFAAVALAVPLAYACSDYDDAAEKGDAGGGNNTVVIISPDGGSSSSGGPLDANVTDQSSPSTEAGVDAATCAATCDLAKEFSDVQPLGKLSGGTRELSPGVSAGENLLAFSSGNGSGDQDLFIAERKADCAFAPGSTVSLANVNRPGFADVQPAFSEDGLRLWLVRGNVDLTALALVTAKRDSIGEPFAEPQKVTIAGFNPGFLNAPFPVGATTLYFVGRSETVPSPKIYRATGVPPTLSAEVFQINGDYPVVDAPETTMYFALTAGGHQMIALSKRSTTADAWGAPTTLASAAINVAGADSKPRSMSADGCRLYFSREDSAGAQLYVATRK